LTYSSRFQLFLKLLWRKDQNCWHKTLFNIRGASWIFICRNNPCSLPQNAVAEWRYSIFVLHRAEAAKWFLARTTRTTTILAIGKHLPTQTHTKRVAGWMDGWQVCRRILAF